MSFFQSKRHRREFILIVIALALAGLMVWSAQNQPVKPEPRDIVRTPTTLTGTYLCLPHRDTSGPQTLECALGLQTDNGDYYALDFNLVSQGVPNFKTGDRLSVKGILTPTEMLSTTHWRIYPIKGILSVTDSVKVLN